MPTLLHIRPDDVRAKCYRALESVLRAYPPLATTGVIWQAYDGTPNPGQGPNRPWIELEPELPAPEPFCLANDGSGRIICEASVLVHVRTRTPGTRADNSIALWGLIERALFRPDDPAEYAKVRARFRAAGCNLVEIVQPATTARDGTVSNGIVRLTTYVLG